MRWRSAILVPSSPFPLRFGRKLSPRPSCIGLCVFAGDGHHGPPLPTREVGPWPFRMTPGCTRLIPPPLRWMDRLLCVGGWREHQRARLTQLGRQTGMPCCIDWAFSHRAVARGLDEGCKLRVGHLGAVHPESAHPCAACCFFGIAGVAHRVGPCRDPDQVFLCGPVNLRELRRAGGRRKSALNGVHGL